MNNTEKKQDRPISLADILSDANDNYPLDFTPEEYHLPPTEILTALSLKKEEIFTAETKVLTQDDIKTKFRLNESEKPAVQVEYNNSESEYASYQTTVLTSTMAEILEETGIKKERKKAWDKFNFIMCGIIIFVALVAFVGVILIYTVKNSTPTTEYYNKQLLGYWQSQETNTTYHFDDKGNVTKESFTAKGTPICRYKGTYELTTDHVLIMTINGIEDGYDIKIRDDEMTWITYENEVASVTKLKRAD